MKEENKLVEISLTQLLEGGKSVEAEIRKAFGPGGLGALTVSNVPGLTEARKELLELAPRLANLPDRCLKQYEDPESSWTVGWSCGKEAMHDGKVDTHKGSFYANPKVDVPSSDKALIYRFPSLLRPNIWPQEDLPEIEPAFKTLSRMIVDVGLLLLDQCDRYIESECPGSESGRLRKVVENSQNHKARLLHYFPANKHNGGLTSAMYLNNGQEVANPNPETGLYIRNRYGDTVKAPIPADHLAFQVGEALEIHSGGLLKATPHYVKAAVNPEAAGVSRNTLAVFMQPGVLETLESPPGVEPSSLSVGEWREGMNFGEFSEATFKKYYNFK